MPLTLTRSLTFSTLLDGFVLNGGGSKWSGELLSEVHLPL